MQAPSLLFGIGVYLIASAREGRSSLQCKDCSDITQTCNPGLLTCNLFDDVCVKFEGYTKVDDANRDVLNPELRVFKGCDYTTRTAFPPTARMGQCVSFKRNPQDFTRFRYGVICMCNTTGCEVMAAANQVHLAGQGILEPPSTTQSPPPPPLPPHQNSGNADLRAGDASVSSADRILGFRLLQTGLCASFLSWLCTCYSTEPRLYLSLVVT